MALSVFCELIQSVLIQTSLKERSAEYAMVFRKLASNFVSVGIIVRLPSLELIALAAMLNTLGSTKRLLLLRGWRNKAAKYDLDLLF
jgi:hypothetical protein